MIHSLSCFFVFGRIIAGPLNCVRNDDSGQAAKFVQPGRI